MRESEVINNIPCVGEGVPCCMSIQMRPQAFEFGFGRQRSETTIWGN